MINYKRQTINDEQQTLKSGRLKIESWWSWAYVSKVKDGAYVYKPSIQ